MSADPIHPWRNRRRGRTRAWLAALLAVLGHLAFLGLLLILSHVHLGQPEARKPPPRPVSLRALSAEQWARNRSAAAPKDSLAQRSRNESRAQPVPDPELKKKKKEIQPQGQVVDVAPGNGEESPDARYLAESDNRVDRETRAKEQTAFYRNAMPQRTTNVPREGGGNDAVEKPQVAGNDGIGNDDRPQREAGKKQPMFEIPDQQRRQEVALKAEPGAGPGPQIANRPERAEVRGNSDRLKVQPGEAGGEEEGSAGRRGAPGIANLMPSAAVLDKITGAAPNDHLGDVEEGQGTFLNTKEWKYSSFFNRVKQSVGMHWDPGNQLRQRDPTGQIYGGRDRYTILSVTLNERGMVKEVYVEKSCGLDFLDLEAIKSFERAQPFPNPPPGLLDDDHTIRFSFGFFLEMGSGTRLRLFRQGG